MPSLVIEPRQELLVDCQSKTRQLEITTVSSRLWIGFNMQSDPNPQHPGQCLRYCIMLMLKNTLELLLHCFLSDHIQLVSSNKQCQYSCITWLYALRLKCNEDNACSI